jgi:hypothetical protein
VAKVDQVEAIQDALSAGDGEALTLALDAVVIPLTVLPVGICVWPSDWSTVLPELTPHIGRVAMVPA